MRLRLNGETIRLETRRVCNLTASPIGINRMLPAL